MVVGCISGKAKKELIKKVNNLAVESEDESTRSKLLNMAEELENIEECETGNGKQRRKRKPSAYNIFIGKCMKQGK